MSEHEAKTTRDHDTIRRWVEERGGRPATVRGTARGAEPGLLRIDFQEPDENLEPLEWDEFFEKFDEAGLTFLYQEETADGGLSRFNKFVYEQSDRRKAGPPEQGREGRGPSAEEGHKERRQRGSKGR
jgi:catechol 2,3-dioxygenase-like lactoylglutathione lyase family enzyme